MSIKEIAAETGYEHAASFDRKFGRHFHETPGQFRRQRSGVVKADPKNDTTGKPTS
jgi:AraC-like DNA-binding protein